MDKSITDNAVEQIAVNPDQTIQLVQNEDKFKNTAQYNQAVFDPSVVTPKTAKTLDDLSDWKEYLHDPWTATESGEFRFEKYKPVMDMSRDPVWYSLAQKYGRDMVMKTDTILGYYKPGGNALSRAIGAYNFASDSLRLADARRRLSDARAAGRELDVPDIENEIAELKYRLGNEEAPFQSENWNSLASVAASSVRNLPELVGIELLGGAAKAAAAAAIGSTGGLATPLAVGAISGAENVAQSAVIYGDTYNIEFGNVLHDIMSVRPDMPESEAREIARVGANISAAIEAAPSLLGGNIESVVAKRTGGAVLGKSGQRSVWAGIKAIAKRDPAAAKEVMKWLFKTAGEMGINMGTESVQEVLQDIATGSAVKAAAEGGDIAQLTEQQIVDFVTNPLAPENRELWNTFKSTAFGTGAFDTATRMLTGGLGRGSNALRNTLGRRKELPTIEQQGLGAVMNTELADRLYQMRQEGKTPDEVQKELWDRTIERGIAPENVYLDKQMAEALMQDPAVNEAIKQLGIQAALEESNNNGGLVEINFADYDEVVNKNDELYQKIRTAISFSPEALSLNQFQAYVDSLNEKSRTEIETARQLSDSVYNRVRGLLEQQGVDRQLAEAQAITAQFMANRVGTLRLGQTATGEQAFSRLEIRMPDQPTTTSGLNQLITYNGEQKDLFNDVYTMGGKQVKYMGLDGKYTTGVNRAAITDDSSVKVIKMSPREFLSLTPYQMGSTDVSKLEDVVNNGGEIAMPFLTVEVEDPEKKTLRVIGHEGRHRSLALQNLGAARGYTVLESKDFYRQPELFKNGIAGWKILPQKGALYEGRSFDIEGDARGSVGETITVDGTERPTRNSEGKLIAENEESLTNFWRWFGDSKVVDEQGRPLVVYHGTGAEFEAFDKEKIGKNAAKLGGGFYTTNVEREAGGYGKAIALYASIKNPINTETFSKNISQEDRQKLYDYLKPYCSLDKGFRDNLTGDDDSFLHDLYFDIDYQVRNEKYFEALKSVLGADGVINYVKGTDNTYEFVAFDNTQLKRTDNLGTWSPTDERMLHQFVGENANLEKEAPELAKRLARAKEMEAEGKSDEEIFNETHVHIGADGRLRVQISDKDAKIKNIKRRKDGRMPAVSVDKGMTLGDVLDHPLLFALYPRLKSIPVQFKGNSSYLSQDPITGEIKFINFRTSEGEKSFIHSVLHETQHAIQNIESWARGGQQKGRQASGRKVYERWKLLEEISPVLKKAGVGGYWNVTTGGRFDFIEPDESRALQDSPAVKELEAKDKDFAAKIARLRELNSELEQADNSDSRVRYMRLFAEAEARLTEKLAGKSQEELDALDPYGYFDVTEFVVRDRAGTYLGARKAPANKQTTGEFTITVSPEATEAIVGDKTGEGQVIAGTFFRDGDKLVISLTPNANATTLTHELFHWFSYELQDAYNSGAMTDYWKKKVEAMARMVDAKFEVDPVDSNVKRLFLTPAQEEKAADMFLNFIKDGKIQNQEARPLFSYLQDEFRRIFKLANIQGYKMSPDAYELFNSIFSAQDVIEDEQRMVGMFQIVKPENADQDLYDFYTGEMASSQVRGTYELHKKWAGIEKYRKSEEYRNKFNEIRLDVAQELNQDTRYIVIDEANKHGGDAMATWNALMANPETSDLELSVDQVADIIANTPDKTTEIGRVANERMNEYIQQRFKITPEEMGLKASRNASKVKALLAEALMREGKVLADFDNEYRVLSQTADDQVAKTKLSRLSDKDYWDTLESNIVERYAYALVNKDERAMAQARRDQAIVNAIRMRADSITSRARRFQETADEFRGAQKKNSKTNEFKYAAKDYDLLQSLLESFGFPINYARRKPQPVAQKLDTWIDEQEATTMTRAGELRNFIPFIKEGFKGNFPAMTGAQFEKLEAVFNAVKSVAGAKYSILLANDKALLSELVASTNKNMEAMGIGPFRKKDGWWVKHFGVMSTFTNPEPIVRAIFPQDVLNKVWLPFIDAGVRAERFGREWVERYRIAKSKVDLTNKTKTYSNGRTLSNKQVADLLLAMGNQHAYENFLKSYDNMTEAEAEQVVSEALTDHPELADFAKDVWDIYGKATEQLDQEFEARTNTLFVEKDHRAFEINGIKFAGGYVPARKALDYVPTDQRAGNEGGMVHDKRFEKLITKKADGNIRSIVDITENELFQSAKQGYSAVEFNNARKFLLADGTKAAIGDRAFSFLSQWMEAYIAPKYDTSGWIRPLQSLTSVSALGWRVSTAVLQLSGLGPAAAELGGTYWARGLAMAMKNGEWAPVMSTRKGANKSDYMFVRIADPRSSLLGNSIVDAVRATDAKTQFGKTAKFLMGKVGNAAMWGIQQVDTMVANVTWNGAYLRALDKGLSEVEARREADSVVRVVQSDSMQISRSQGMQDQLARVFTVFATWIMAMQSNLRAKIGTKQYSNAIVWAAMYMVLSPIFESFLKEATKPEVLFGDGDDEDYVDRVMRACYNEVANTIGTSLIPAAGAGGTILEMLLSGLEEGLTDEKNIFEPRQSNVPILQTLYRGTNTLRYALSGNLEKAATYGAGTVSTEAGRIVKYLLAE